MVNCEGVLDVVMITVVRDCLLHSVHFAEASCKNMPRSPSACTSKSLLLQSSTTSWGCRSGCWGSLSLQGQALGLPGEWRYVKENWVSLLAVMFGFTVVLISPDRLHWKVWNQSSVGRLQEEPQRRHSATEDSQNLHCKILIFLIHLAFAPCITYVLSFHINSVSVERSQDMWEPLSNLSGSKHHHPPSGWSASL